MALSSAFQNSTQEWRCFTFADMHGQIAQRLACSWSLRTSNLLGTLSLLKTKCHPEGSMRITIIAPENVFELEVDPSMELQDVLALIEAEVSHESASSLTAPK